MQLMSGVGDLKYHWALAYMTPGAATQLWQRKVNTSWKPVLWFVNGEYKGDWVQDVTKSIVADKDFHEWGQSESGMQGLIERLSKPGDLILDPFLGGGATGAMAIALRRRFIGSDIDKKWIDVTAGRIATEKKDRA